jgi:hypothetical protein
MEVVYCNIEKVYLIKMSPSEAVTIINTEDIVEAREEFLQRMKQLFNDAICKRLNYTPKESAYSEEDNK